MPIKVLDAETAAKIAAGEVITGPGAVIKELVENSIDAGSTRINIAIEDGGKKSIKVMDNGTGICSDEVDLSFKRHATSKISNLEDLNTLNSLGFRGEALASIKAISKVTVKTQRREESLGTQIYIAGKDNKVIKKSFSPGTSITVEELFYNTPARLKHMRKSKELSREIIELVERLSLSNPSISFSLTVDNKKILQTPGDGSLHNAIYSIFGKEFGKNLIELSYENKPLTLSGFLGKASYTKRNRKNQYLYINNRFIQDRKILNVIEEAYENAIMINQHPVFIINITIPPHMLDVNVHPSKTTVKILNESLVLLLIKDGVVKTLRSAAAVTSIQPKTEKIPLDDNLYVQEDFVPTIVFKDDKPTRQVEQKRELYEEKKSIEEKKLESNKELKIKVDAKEHFEFIKVVGQLFNTYILLEGNDYILLIDQHAAHERILFEDLMDTVKSSNIRTQQIIPQNFSLSASDFQNLLNNKSVFETIGFEFEEFGTNTICLRGVPVFLGISQNSNLLLEILESIEGKTDKLEIERFQEKVIMTACKKAIKGNKRLDNSEINRLIKDLRNCEFPYTCPHGRPTVVKLTKGEFERQFKRI